MFEFILSNIPTLVILGAIGYALMKVSHRRKHQAAALEFLEHTSTIKDQPLSLHPEIDPSLCSGCGACTTSCPEGEILQMIDHKAELVAPSKCVGHGECERACPMGAIKLVFGSKTRGVEIPRLTTNYETNIPGVYIAGELGGMGLIRNAVKQGVAAAKHAIENLDMNSTAQTDILIIGSGPAGFSAALAAIAEKTNYTLIDQNVFGGTISNFPRQKLVMTHPFDLPLVGMREFDKNTVSKEELLSYWNHVRKKTGLKIREGVKFEGLEKNGNVFTVKTAIGNITAKKVILALGTRGSARKLNIPGENLAKVTYNLEDAEQYYEKRLVVVGGGNSAAEAVQLLAQQGLRNKVYMIVRGAGLERCNAQNEAAIKALAKAGKIAVWYESKLDQIEEDRVTVRTKKEIKVLKNDFVLIFAGSELPRQFLMSLGVQMEKKFGQGLGA